MTLDTIGSVLLLGCGKMGGAMLEGWLARGLSPSDATVIEPSPSPEVAALLASHGVTHLASGADARVTDVIVVAVKPQVMDAALPSVAGAVGPSSLAISVAAGKTLADLGALLPANTAIVRTIPNTPAAIGEGMTVGMANACVSDTQKTTTDALLSVIGDFAWIDDEALMDAVTAVSGSGPAYVFLLAECLAEAGRRSGLPGELAARLARQTVAGAGALLAQSELDAATLRQNVTSPNGTTAAALSVLMAEPGVQALMTEAVAAATRRSGELSG